MIRHVRPLHLALGPRRLLSVNNEREGGPRHKITHVLMAGEDGALCIRGKNAIYRPGRQSRAHKCVLCVRTDGEIRHALLENTQLHADGRHTATVILSLH